MRKIERIETVILDIPTIRGHVLSMTTMMMQSIVLVTARFSDGSVGLGEGATIGGMSYGPESPESIKTAIDAYIAPLLEGRDADDVNGAIGLVEKAVRGNPIARCAVEIALWDEAIGAGGGSAHAFEADLEAWEGCAAAMARAVDLHGRIDVLVNNVGGTIWAKPYEHYAPAEIEAEVRRSLFPTLYCCRAALDHILKPMAPRVDFTGVTFTRPVKAPGSPVSQLFKDGLGLGTLLIWTTFFMSLLVFYLLSSWLPLLITTAGFSMANASLMGATLATGGTVGAILIGRLMDRFEPHKVLAGAYLIAGFFVILLGNAVSQPWLLVLAIFGAGFGVAGAQVGVNALAAGFYPTTSRATGVSWANAVGRTGSVLGSMVGGVLLSLGWDLATVFAAAALPAFLAAVAMFAKSRLGRLALMAGPITAPAK